MMELLVHPLIGVSTLVLALIGLVSTMLVTEVGTLGGRSRSQLLGTTGVLTVVALTIIVVRFVVLAG